jgi:uncharacterized membrane protein
MAAGKKQSDATFRRRFVTGLFIILPLWVTVWVIRLVFGEIDASVTPLIYRLVRLFGGGDWIDYAWVNYFAPLVSVVLAVLSIYLLGMFGGNVLGKQVLRMLEGLLLRVPVVRGIYATARQFLDTFSRPGGQAFSSVVLIEFPRPGSWALGFLTGETQGEVRARMNQKLCNVFLPTAPNPTSGYVVFVAEREIVRLTMSVDDALKMIVSGGVLSPPYTSQATAAKVEEV